ncbi:MAG: hypothetical protein AB7H86_07895 [Blastocatellales bacterium]
MRKSAILICLVLMAGVLRAQDPPAEDQAKAARETQAWTLLDQVITDSQGMRLPENRIHVIVEAGGMLWERDEVRARALFSETAAAVRDMFNNLDPKDQDYGSDYQTALNTRREFLLALSELDPKLAYELMLATRPSEQVQEARPGRGGPGGRFGSEAELEMRLLSEVADSDPLTALRNAQDMLNKGQFPNSLVRTLSKMRAGNPQAADKLSESIVEKLTPETILSKIDAGNLALSLLRPGPVPADAKEKKSSQIEQVLNESAFRSLLQNVVTVSLSYQPSASTGGRGGNRRGGFPVPGNAQTGQDMTQINARRIYANLSTLLPQIEKYLPNKAAQVKQKIAQNGDTNQMLQRQMMAELGTLMREGTVETILQAARNAPPELQSRYYQQAAIKAVNDDNTAVAEQIAGQFLNEQQRGQVTQAIERQRARQVALAGNLDQLRQNLGKMRSDEERVSMLARLASDAWKQKNEKLATELIGEARSMVSGRAKNYRRMEAQLMVARVAVEVDPAAASELISTCISQLNDLIPAASTLSGFDVRIFRDDELPLEGNSSLHRMISTVGEALGMLAQNDFERARTASDQFQQTESRTIARLAVISGALGKQSNRNANFGFNAGGNFGPRGNARRP